MEVVVRNVLEEAALLASQFKPTDVHKDIELDIDLGSLLAVDQNVVGKEIFTPKIQESLLKDLARDNTQCLINRIWQLPIERVEDAVVVQLPPPTTVVPREKPIPQAKAQTKWEKFAAAKGIKQTKKSRMVWDDAKKEWRPNWGYKRANDDTKDWVIEVPANADPYEDQFEKRSKAKQERTAKNELQRLRNIARSRKSKVPGVGITPTETTSKDKLSYALSVAKKSTASVGKFTENLPKEKPHKGSGRKRKFESNSIAPSAERDRQMTLVNSLLSKKPVLDVDKAVNQSMYEEQKKRRKMADGDKGKPRKAGKKGTLRKGAASSGNAKTSQFKGYGKQRGKGRK